MTAVSCSEVYAEEWDFSNQSECEARCHEYYDGTSAISDGACEEPLLDLYECGAALTCEQFQEMEKDQWVVEEFIPDPACDEEFTALVAAGSCT